MHVICLCYPCTLLYSSCMQQQGERASERADRTWTNGRTNQPTWTNEPTNQPGTKRTNESVTHKHSTAQHSTALRGYLTHLTFTHETKKKFPSLRTPRLRLRLPSPPRRYAFRLPLTPTLVGRATVRAQVLYDYAVPLALYPAKMYQ